jgi:elongation factor P
MDTENFEQSELEKNTLGNAVNFLKENMKVNVMFYQGKVLGIDLPNVVELKVVETDPGIRGDTATGGTKPATMDTGYVVKVPLFVEAGDVLRIDTRTGEYVERA